MSEVKPTLLHQGPHPVHECMAEEIGAELDPAEHIRSPAKILYSSLTKSYEGPVIIEGGMPLLHGSCLKLFNQIEGPLILLAADETQLNLKKHSLSYISAAEEAIHSVTHKFVDGAIAVSDPVAEATQALVDGPIKVSEPFIESSRYQNLPTHNQTKKPAGPLQVLNVGEYKPGNGQDLLIDSLEYTNANIEVSFVGPGTGSINSDDKNINALGFVDESTLIEKYCSSDLLVFSGRTGAFPVATLEAWRAGLPTLVTKRIGTAPYVHSISNDLVVECNPRKIADGIEWFASQSTEYREKLGSKFYDISSEYSESRGRLRFKRAYNEMLEELDYS